MRLYKNLTATALCTALSTVSHAGWYSNLSLGIADVHVQKKLTYSMTQADFTSAYRGFQGQLGLGYDTAVKSSWRLGIEGNFDGISGRSRYDINNWFLSVPASASENLRYAGSLYLLPVYQFHDRVRVFFGPGISAGRFKVNSGTVTAGNIGLSGHRSHWLGGWALKAGASIACTDVLDLQLTYQYAEYKRTHYTNIEPLSGTLLHASYRPDVGTALIGLRYTFDRPMVSSMK